MRLSRLLTLCTLSALATAWAGTLVVAGLWMSLDAPRRWPAAAWPGALGGCAFMAMGLFLFLTLVADRWFPHAGRRLGWWVELGLLAVFLPCLVAVGIWFFSGALT